jgi:predicted  nucleic acid-binding Zn ribbon protein
MAYDTTPDASHVTVAVEQIQVLTNILDGGVAVRCVCDHIFRVPSHSINDRECCPSCGRNHRLHATIVSNAEYKASRSVNTLIVP